MSQGFTKEMKEVRCSVDRERYFGDKTTGPGRFVYKFRRIGE